MKEPKIDARTRQYMAKWHPQEIPQAQVTGGIVTPGTYRSLATLGWIERQGPMAVCGVHFLLLRNHEFKPFGTLSLAMPVTKNTELLVNSFLHVLGWDGRVWPFDGDGGWPENSEEDVVQVRAMLSKLKPKVGSTLTFPPKEDMGVPLLTLPVLKREAPYPLAPFEPVSEDSEPPVIHLERFRSLCRDPSPFAVLN